MEVKCGTETIVYSRVVGYYSPTRNWNKGKKEEFAARKTFNLDCFREEASISALTPDREIVTQKTDAPCFIDTVFDIPALSLNPG